MSIVGAALFIFEKHFDEIFDVFGEFQLEKFLPFRRTFGHGHLEAGAVRMAKDRGQVQGIFAWNTVIWR